MLRLFAAALIAMLAGAASAEEWHYEDLGTPIAYFDNGAAQFQFACRGGDLAMGFWVRSPNAKVAGARAMNLALTPDPKPGSSGGDAATYAQDMPLIHADGSSVIVRGPVARQWAKIAQQAKAAMRVAYVHKNAAGKFEYFDGNQFGATGSSAAIKQVLDRCG